MSNRVTCFAPLTVLMALLRKAELDKDTDFLREGVRALSQALMELEVGQHLEGPSLSAV